MIPTLPRSARWAALLATLAMASGCSNLYFHSEARQKQAETATKAWTDIEHESLFKLERENLNKLVQAELQTQQRLAAAKREYLAAAITGPGPAKEDAAAVTKRSVRSVVLERANRNFATLIGPRDAYDKRVAAADKLAPLQKSVAGLAARLQPLGSPVLGCDDLSGTPLALTAEADKWLATVKGPALVGARDSLASLLRDCTSLRTEEANAGTQPPAGQLRIAINQRNQDRRDLAKQRDAFRVAKAEYEEALKDYAAAEAAAQAPASDATVAARVGAAAKRLVTAIAALRGLNNAFAEEFIANETLDSIDESLTAIAAGKAGGDAKKGVVFAVQAPALIDRYRAAMAASRKPLVLPLLIRRNAEQLQRDAAAADVRLLEAKLATSERIVQAVNNEAAAMRRAIRELEEAGALLPAALDEPWAEALFKSSGKAKQLLLSGTARFLDAASRLEGERYSLEYARLAIDHERGLAYAEISVAQWGNLIGAGVGQLEAFAKGGIDKAVLSDIAKIIGLFWIGHGVNK